MSKCQINNEKVEKLRCLINAEIIALENTMANNQKCNTLNNIIQIISLIPIEKRTTNENTYKYVKEFIDSYIKSISSNEWGYDKLNVQQLIDNVETTKIEHRPSLYRMLYHRLREENYLEQDIFLNKYKNSYIKLFNHRLKKFQLRGITEYIYSLCTYNRRTSLLIISLYFLSLICFTGTAFNQNFATIEIKWGYYSSNEIINRIYNILLYSIGENETFSISPLNIFGFLLILLMKGTGILFIANVLLKQLIDRTQ